MILNPSINRYQLQGKGYVVGDIHGNFSALEKALVDIGFDFNADTLFSLGDLVDRGPESHRALEFLQKPWFKSVLGNHCEHVIEFETHNTERWYARGGEWHSKLSMEEKLTWQRAFSNIPIAIEVRTKTRKYGLIHADLPCDDWLDLEYLLDGRDRADVKVMKNRINCCLYSRHRYAQTGRGLGGDSVNIKNVSEVLFGHCPVRAKERRGNCSWLDTYESSGYFTFEILY